MLSELEERGGLRGLSWVIASWSYTRGQAGEVSPPTIPRKDGGGSWPLCRPNGPHCRPCFVPPGVPRCPQVRVVTATCREGAAGP